MPLLGRKSHILDLLSVRCMTVDELCLGIKGESIRGPAQKTIRGALRDLEDLGFVARHGRIPTVNHGLAELWCLTGVVSAA